MELTVTVVSALLIALVALVRKLGGQRDGQNVLPVEPLTRAFRRHGPRQR
ncbi:hypothetical protein [Streptomyces sp. NRRL S-646]|nr:hypothetical protein [Streptomyces sp. NRRL S-646]